MLPTPQRRSQHRFLSSGAFTRMDLCVGLIVAGLLLALIRPALSVTSARGAQLVCLSNLRATGMAFQRWAEDHLNMLPWIAPVANGGNGGSTTADPSYRLRTNLWYEMSYLSNELASPRVFACPQDLAATPAATWGTSPSDGFLSARFLNNSVSYFLSLDSSPEVPQTMLLLDRNASTGGVGACATGIAPIQNIYAALGTQWNPGLHYPLGNAFILDGSAGQYDSPSLNALLKSSTGGRSVLHAMFPR